MSDSSNPNSSNTDLSNLIKFLAGINVIDVSAKSLCNRAKDTEPWKDNYVSERKKSNSYYSPNKLF